MKLIIFLIFLLNTDIAYSQNIVVTTKEFCILKNRPDDGPNNQIYSIPANTSIELINKNKEFVKIKFGENYGYIRGSTLIQFENKVINVKDLYSLEEEPTKKILLTDEELINKYGKSIGTKLINREIWVGMSLSMVKDIFGEPTVCSVEITDDKNIINFLYSDSSDELILFSVTFVDSLANKIYFTNGKKK